MLLWMSLAFEAKKCWSLGASSFELKRAFNNTACMCMVQLKKITITHMYRFKLYSLSLSLLYFFILISFGYTHEFTHSFFLSFFFIEVLMICLYKTFSLLHLINSPRKKNLKKNLNKTRSTKLDSNWNPI